MGHLSKSRRSDSCGRSMRAGRGRRQLQAELGQLPVPRLLKSGSAIATSRTEQHILATYIGLARGTTDMRNEEWVKELEGGRKVKFTYLELPEDGAFITAQIERNEVVYSVVLAKAKNPLSQENVESHFMGELAKK
jgi:hypothetical protein